MGTLEWVVLIGALALGLGAWVRSLLAPPAAAPEPSAGPAVPVRHFPKREASAEVEPLAARGPAAVVELMNQLVGDFREQGRVEAALPALVERLGPAGLQAFASRYVQLALEFRPSVMGELSDAASSIGASLIDPLLALADEASATAIGETLGEILFGREDATRDLETTFGPMVSGADPARAAILGAVLEKTIEELDGDQQNALLGSTSPLMRAAAARFADLDRSTLARLLRDPDARVRRALLRNETAWSEAPEAVLPLFTDSAPEVRFEACLRAGYKFDEQTEARCSDHDPAVVLAALSIVDEDALLPKVEAALASGDPALRLAACRVAANLPPAQAQQLFGVLQLDGTQAELAAFLEEFAAEDLEGLEHLVQFARTDPPLPLARLLCEALCYNDDIPGAADLPAPLLDRSLPPRVRRLGFEALASAMAGRARRIAPFLVADEPQLPDFLWTLRFSWTRMEREERDLYARLKGSPHPQLAHLAAMALRSG